MSDQQPKKDSWHISKEIPISLVVALVLQCLGLVWYGSYQLAAINARINSVEERLDTTKSRVDQLMIDRDKIIRLETKMENMSEILKEIRDKVIVNNAHPK